MPNLALELGKQAASLGVSSVYGEQQDVDGIRLVPVALSWSGETTELADIIEDSGWTACRVVNLTGGMVALHIAEKPSAPKKR